MAETQETLDRLTMKVGFLITDEHTLCKAINELLDDRERLSKCVDELMSDLVKRKVKP